MGFMRKVLWLWYLYEYLLYHVIWSLLVGLLDYPLPRSFGEGTNNEITTAATLLHQLAVPSASNACCRLYNRFPVKTLLTIEGGVSVNFLCFFCIFCVCIFIWLWAKSFIFQEYAIFNMYVALGSLYNDLYIYWSLPLIYSRTNVCHWINTFAELTVLLKFLQFLYYY